jgi:hypothetical protein
LFLPPGGMMGLRRTGEYQADIPLCRFVPIAGVVAFFFLHLVR